ncbi:ExeM/NucH family extracellular endonuclease [Lutimaribacter marinistellae]|uniref:ExeM/NucH family extracellular endonuclease n=1 Tax=Lutimaribacter marinistellae TaxID=1820329 RepID=A0ABV7TKJ2_9RHOB
MAQNRFFGSIWRDSTLTGTSGNDFFKSFFVNDRIETGTGRDLVLSGFGNDTITVGERATVFAGAGDDVITGGTGPLRAYGGFGNDVIVGGDADDRLDGGRGDDIIALGGGNDRVQGGRGFDTAIVEGSILAYAITMRGSKLILDSDTGRDVLRSVEKVQFDDFDLYLDGRNNPVLAGNDTAETTENAAVIIAAATLLANDADFDGDSISILSVDAASAKGATVSFDGTDLVYIPGTLFDSLPAGETTTDTVTYQVTDGKGGTDIATLTITIQGENDDPRLLIEPAIAVDENTTAVASGALATDVDSSSLSFSLSGTDAQSFTIDAATGTLAFATAPDFEAPQDADGDNVYDVTVTVEDGDGGADSTDVAITVSDVPELDARINEFHYDNTGTDVGEFVELRVATGQDASGLGLVFYNGANGTVYRTETLPSAPTRSANGYDYFLVELPTNGMQNGAPDGIALVNGTSVIEFLSYEGSFTAAAGTANGLTSTDIGVSEPGNTPIGQSLQRDEDGDTWRAPEAETRGAANDSGSDPVLDAPYAFDFETDFVVEGWQTISVDADTANTWFADTFSGDNFVEVNAFGDSAPANDWLISPLIDLSALSSPVASFANTKNFDDGGISDPEVSFLYSTDYSGSGDPTAATWVELPFNASTGGFSEVSSGEIDLSGIGAAQVHFAFQYESSGTGGGSSSLWQIDDFAVEDATNAPPAPLTLISEVQGFGTASPLAGTRVTIEAIVVGDFQDGSAGTDGDLNGFFLQEEDLDADGDSQTSEGIFVFDGFSPAVDVATGDLVRITGMVDEFFGETQIDEIESVEVISSGNILPTAATLSFPAAEVTTNSDGVLIADLEKYEGMLVTVPQELTVSDLFTLGRFGDIGLTAGGLTETYTQANAPSVAGFQGFIEDQVRKTLVLDDGSTAQNPSTIPFEIAGADGNIAGQFDAGDALGAGDTVENLTGVLRFGRGSGGSGDEIYRLNPTETPQFVDTNPREDSAPDVGGTITVSSFNVLNFFTSLGDEGLTAGPNALNVRGADNIQEFDRQVDKLVSALAEINADVFGLVELENEIGDQNGDGQFALEYIVDALNLETGGNYQYVDPGVPYVGSDAIMVGMIYDADAVALASGATVEVLTDVDLPGLGLGIGNPVFDGSGTSRAPLAATFEEIASGERFTVAVNHFKSKGSVSPFGNNAGIGEGIGNNNEARLQAAQALDAWLDTDPTGSGDDDVLIIGDLNAYAMEDPITFLKAEGYEDQIEAFLAADAFPLSFGFPVDLDTAPQAQSFGALDYALANGALAAQVTGAAEWRINSVEASALDYNTNFKPQNQIDDLHAANPFRSSDHDPLILGLDLGAPDTLFV